ncbi:metallophosphoesterase [Sphingobacterium sp. E70]|uniref:metallophosphoesterase n=1 Tax=Sphingobacterium sp. E70 TaxID=2853439 RepID=UPI00211CACC2|nr:metallophosphoesterase [Sphingobacterium sp. E70]ULT25824.1 metallophosphoesterase [Sphingobacterium sp. E70]
MDGKATSQSPVSIQKVIVFTHHPLYPENGLEALNNREILTLIEKYPVVKVVISGHHHPGNFATYKGIPMITLEDDRNRRPECLWYFGTQ